jgi:DNA topoisomerase-1
VHRKQALNDRVSNDRVPNGRVPNGRVTAAFASLSSARLAVLHHSLDDQPGITRHKAPHRGAGSGFDYRRRNGQPVRDIQTLRRIRSLAIPPAWNAVWINPDPLGHLQATGRDRRGRKQYRYHPRWRQVRDEAKFDKMLTFARVLPLIRARVDADLRRRGLPRDRVLAAIVRLLEQTLFRVGNSEYAKVNKSFGLTTLRDRHADIRGSHIRLSFRGKGGIRNETDIDDPRLARIVKSCRDLPGHELFQYLNDAGQRHTVGSTEVNLYLREITGEDITAKDFRTWAGTTLAALALREIREYRQRVNAQKGCRARRRTGRPAPRQHAGNLPSMLYPSGDCRWVPRRNAAHDP